MKYMKRLEISILKFILKYVFSLKAHVLDRLDSTIDVLTNFG
jgi:hypothetical protein